MFPRLPAWQHLLRTENILCAQQMFPSLRSPRNIMGNNVSATMCPRLPGPLECLYNYVFMSIVDALNW